MNVIQCHHLCIYTCQEISYELYVSNDQLTRVGARDAYEI